MKETEAVTAPSRWGASLERARELVLEYMIVFVVAALFIVLALTSSAFLSTNNFQNILSQNAPLGIVACGITLVIIAGGFDLSVGAIFSLAGVVAAWSALNIDPVLGLIAGVFAAAVVGAVNGFVVVVLRVNSFLATLASSLMIGGIALAITGGFLINVTDLASFTYIGNESLFGLQYSVYFFAATAVVLGVVLRSTAFGRHIYAAGGNPEAARLSGLRVGLIRAMTFVICGVTAGIAGVLQASKSGAGEATLEAGMALDAIAAVVLGGTSISGGDGAMWRTVLGVLLLALIVNGFNLLNVQPEFRQLITGAIIIAAVALNTRASESRG